MITRNPETQAGKDLLKIVKHINQIKTQTEKDVFLNWLDLYESRYCDFINERTYSKDPEDERKWWYTHKNLRSSFKLLKYSSVNMFPI